MRTLPPEPPGPLGCSGDMRSALVTALAALLALGVASPTGTVRSDRSASRPPATVLAIRSMRGASELLRLSRRTLLPVRGEHVRLDADLGDWAFSPDGTRLAIGSERALGLRFVDVKRMRVTGGVQTRNGQIEVVAWLAPRRIVGVEATGLFVVDPVAGRLIQSQALDGHPIGVGRTADSLVLLLAPTEEIGMARLALVDLEGRLRTVVLDRIPAGWRYQHDASSPPGESRRPGLALDAAGGRAFVVGGGSPVAEVDLATLAVDYHEPARKASFLGRLRAWLEPEAQAKGPVAGSWRSARWLGGGFLAVTGEDGHVAGPDRVETTSAGLTLIDTRTWEARTLAGQANGMAFAAGTLLATFHDPFDPSAGIGLRGFARDGSKRFHLFGGQQVGLLGTLDDRAFVDAIGGTHVVRLGSGRATRWSREPPQLLVGT